MNKDQYKIAVELNQVIWDGGAIRSQKNNLQASSDVENKKLDVEMYELNDRVNQLYFGILLIDGTAETKHTVTARAGKKL